MVQASAPTAARPAAPAPSAAPGSRRPPLSRFSAAHGLMVASGLLAFVLVAALLASRDDTVRVAVAGVDIAPGAVVSPSAVRWAELPADSTLAPSLVSPAGLGSRRWVSTRPVSSGQPLRGGDLAPAGASDALRWFALAVPREHAAGGALAPGDRVDVIDVVDGTAAFVVTGVEVAKVVTAGSGRGITAGTGRDFTVVVRVDAAQALAPAAALSDDKVEVVRSTAAAPAFSAPAPGAAAPERRP